MATLILGTVGRAAGGPLGGLFGTFLGSALDRAVLGGPRREVGRLANLAVQSSAYGEPIPQIFGTMRVAGNLVWTAGIAEHSTGSGGGKGGTATTAYSYSASFAVLLSARTVAAVARIWADGKLLRDADGTWLVPVTMRLHRGGDGQLPDPLIVAAEGAGGTPAYRGLAYAVFEDLPLADYGNRIPNLTFEVVAETRTDAGSIVAALAPDGVAAGSFPEFTGFAAAQTGGARDQLGALTELFDLRYVDDGARLIISAGSTGDALLLAADDLGSEDAGSRTQDARSETRGAADQLDDAVAIGFHDPARDYQPGLQRSARRAAARRVAQLDVAAALDADTAKRLAADLLSRRSAARTGATFNLPPRWLGLRSAAALVDDSGTWTARRWTFSNFLVELSAERSPAKPVPAPAPAADSGRVHDPGDAPAGPTTLQILDLPLLPWESAPSPRLLVAAAGASPGWRRSPVALSANGGDTYLHAGVAGAASIMGTTVAAIAAGDDDRWDRTTRLEVELLGDAMWLESRSEAAVLAGANLAVVGDEIVQFATVTALGGRRFALTGLLRGRRGSVASDHPAASRLVVLDPDRLLRIEPGVEAVARTLRLRATGSGDGATPPVLHSFDAVGARPLAPAFLRLESAGGDLVFNWTRRAAAGFAWQDAVDVPQDPGEAYAVTLSVGGSTVRSATTDMPRWRYAAADRAADGIGPATSVTLAVSQVGTLAGPAAVRSFILS